LKDEIFSRFPEMIKSILEKIEQTNISKDTEEIKHARNLLIKKLKGITENIANLAEGDGEKLTEEQQKVIKNLPI